MSASQSGIKGEGGTVPSPLEPLSLNVKIAARIMSLPNIIVNELNKYSSYTLPYPSHQGLIITHIFLAPLGDCDNRQAIYCLYGNDTYWLVPSGR